MIRLSSSSIGETEKQAVMGVLDRKFLGMGAEVQQFEEEIASFFGRPAVCVVNGTAALQLALQAVGVRYGDEVLVQSLTYVASFQAISATGATPIACDVDPVTLCLDWHDAEKRLTSNTKAIMPVHYSGGVGALGEIYLFAEKYGLRVIEDAAHAFGSIYQNKLVGGFGDIACFSFDGIKNITSGEGGCIVTDDETVLQKVRDARLLGVEKDSEKRFSGERSWKFDVTAQGWRYHMSNIMASIGIEQFKRLPEFTEKRRSLARKYDECLAGSGLQLLRHDYYKVVPHIYVVILQKHINRDALRKRLNNKGIETGVHYFPNHFLKYYNSITRKLVVTENIYSKLLSLPLHCDIEQEDVIAICGQLTSEINRLSREI